MKTWLLAAMVAAGLARPAAAAVDMDMRNGVGEALEFFQMPMSSVGVTTLVSSTSTAMVTSVNITATFYWAEVFVMRNLAVSEVIGESATPFLIATWSGTWTGGAANTPLTQWLNFARGVPFGILNGDKVVGDDELTRYGSYRIGMDGGTPIRFPGATLRVITPQLTTAGFMGATVVVIYGTQPYGVVNALRTNLGSN